MLAWGDQAVPRAPRQERANGAPHPNHPANQGAAQVRGSGVGLCASQGRVAREVRERREEEVLEEAREENEGEEFIFKWVTTFLHILVNTFRGGTHPVVVLAGLNQLCKENTFTDVRIQVALQD